MSISKSLFGSTVNVPTRGEKGWATEVTNIITQLVDFANGVGSVVSGVSFLNMSTTTKTATAASTINPTHNVMVVSAAGPVTLSTTIPIASWIVSYANYIILIGTSDTNTITIEDGGTVLLNGNCTLGLGKSIILVWDATSKWVEVSRNG